MHHARFLFDTDMPPQRLYGRRPCRARHAHPTGRGRGRRAEADSLGLRARVRQGGRDRDRQHVRTTRVRTIDRVHFSTMHG